MGSALEKSRNDQMIVPHSILYRLCILAAFLRRTSSDTSRDETFMIFDTSSLVETAADLNSCPSGQCLILDVHIKYLHVKVYIVSALLNPLSTSED